MSMRLLDMSVAIKVGILDSAWTQSFVVLQYEATLHLQNSFVNVRCIDSLDTPQPGHSKPVDRTDHKTVSSPNST